MGFSENLKNIRKSKNITQGDLAKIVNMHANHISRYERGEANPSAEVVKQFSEALEVSADQLLFGDRKEYISKSFKDNDLISLLKKIENLGQQEKDTVKDLISAYIFRNETKKRLSSV